MIREPRLHGWRDFIFRFHKRAERVRYPQLFLGEKTSMGRCKIICSLDGQELEHALYGAYENPKTRTFPSEQYAKPVVTYLSKRAVRLGWNSAFPNYQIVPGDE